MANQKMGFEGQLFIGAAGATATTQIGNATDITYDLDNETGETTVRGTGTTVPIKTETVTKVSAQVEWTMIFDVNDGNVTMLMGAAAAGTPVAVRLKDNPAGKGLDADCGIKVQNGMPLNGQQTKQFTATPCRDAGRAPQLYV